MTYCEISYSNNGATHTIDIYEVKVFPPDVRVKMGIRSVIQEGNNRDTTSIHNGQRRSRDTCMCGDGGVLLYTGSDRCFCAVLPAGARTKCKYMLFASSSWKCAKKETSARNLMTSTSRSEYHVVAVGVARVGVRLATT